jgi:hypothetical protein
MTPQEQQAHANAIRLEIIKEKQAEIDRLSRSLANMKEAYVKDARKMQNGTKVIVHPKYGAKFYGLIKAAHFDEDSEFDFVRYMVKPVKKGWVKPEGYNRRHSVEVTKISEILHIERSHT